MAAIAGHGLEDVIDAPGFVDEEVIEDALAHALCLVLPSRREGYALVVVETLSKGTPVVLVQGEDNASTEFIEEAPNGFVSADASAPMLAVAIVKVRDGGASLRDSTLVWFTGNAVRLSLASSLEPVAGAYEPSQPRARPRDIAK